MKELLQSLIEKFNTRVASDPALQEELAGITKTVVIDLQDGTSYHFVLRDTRIEGPYDGTSPSADVTILTDPDTLKALIAREMGPFKAYALGKVKLKGSFEDLLRFRKFF